MKKILLIALLLAGASAKSQFFQGHYGINNDNNQLTDGINTNAVGFGHFMVGNTFTNAGTMPLTAVRTDQNGSILPPYFANNYFITSGANNVFVVEAKTVEIPGGAGFGVVMGIRGAGVDGLAYMTLDPSGNVLNIVRHFTNPGFILQLGAVVVNDLTNNDATAVGSVINVNVSPPEYYTFAYNFDINTGAINWSNYYDFVNGPGGPIPGFNTFIYDVDQIPGTGLLTIVGNAYGLSMLIGDNPFYFPIDVTTGALVAPPMVYDFAPGVNDDIRAVDFSTGTGLVAVTGNMDIFGQKDEYIMLLAPPVGFPVWGTLEQYNTYSSVIPPAIPSGILTRTNTAGVPEFYVTGTATNGNLGQSDAFVYKLDVNLMPVGQFTYGNGFNGQGIALDGYDGTGFDGLSAFGRLDPGVTTMNQDFHLVKSYFSGESGCNELLQTPILQYIGPPFFAPLGPNIFTNVIMSAPGLSTSRTTATSNILCYNTSIGGGSNAKVAPTDKGGDRVAKLSPNPMAQGSQAVLLEINTEVAFEAEVGVYDMLGRQYYSGKHLFSSGDNRLPIDLSAAIMAQGSYIVKITGADYYKTIPLLVK